jgi:acetyl esterase/lipase
MFSSELTQNLPDNQLHEFIPIWPPDKKPNYNGTTIRDRLYDERIWKVRTPGMYSFKVSKMENKGTAVLICPGGSYERLHHVSNGFEFAKWFNARGINAFVLIYRLPHQEDLEDRELAPLQDAQRAMKIIRAHALAWGLQKDKIGVMGVSAGGHVATTLATHSEDVSAINDPFDSISYQEDFTILLSPVITMKKEHAHVESKKNFFGGKDSEELIKKYSNELHVNGITPPTFIVHAQNDMKVPVKNSLLYYNALIDKNISASIHVFPDGDHAIKANDNPGSSALWLELLELWLKEKDFL